MKIHRLLVLLLVLSAFLLQACGPDTEAAIATGIAQTQRISALETAAAGGGVQPTEASTPEPAAGVVEPPALADAGDEDGGNGAPSDSNIVVEIDISNEDDQATIGDEISSPEGDTSDQIFIRIVGFSGNVDSGNLRLTLTCSGEGVDDVEVSTSLPRTNGSSRCGRDWEHHVTVDDDGIAVVISLPSGVSANVSWSLTVEVK